MRVLYLGFGLTFKFGVRVGINLSKPLISLYLFLLSLRIASTANRGKCVFNLMSTVYASAIAFLRSLAACKNCADIAR